jgi:phosphoglucomutase
VKIVEKFDYKLGVKKDLMNISESSIKLPRSNVLKFVMEDKSWFVVRPSGTEPKIKIYLSVIGNSLENSRNKMTALEKNVMDVIKSAD